MSLASHFLEGSHTTSQPRAGFPSPSGLSRLILITGKLIPIVFLIFVKLWDL